MTHLLLAHGLVILFALVAVESAGVPLPGETALITAAILAQRGHYTLLSVIVVAAAAAITGDNVAYWIARFGGRKLLRRWAPIERYADRVLPRAERFFAKHGAKTVFFGRFVAVLRITAAWLAGLGRMPWWRFLLWNASGGIAWAVVVSLVAYEFGKAAAAAISHYGLIGIGAIVVVGLIAFVALRLWQRRALETT